MERRVDLEITSLRQDLVTMAGMAETAIGKAVRALVVRDRNLSDEVRGVRIRRRLSPTLRATAPAATRTGVAVSRSA